MSRKTKSNQLGHSQREVDVDDSVATLAEVHSPVPPQMDDRPGGIVRQLNWVALDWQTRRTQLGMTFAEPLEANTSALTLSLEPGQVRELWPMLYQILATLQAPVDAQLEQNVLIPMRVGAWEILSTLDTSQFVLHFQVAHDIKMLFSLARTDAFELARAILAVDATKPPLAQN